MAYRGESLRALREHKRIQLSRIANETRITQWYLAGIEEERFERFPGRFYFKSFAREYARFLGLEPSEVLRDLQPAYDAWSGHHGAHRGSSKPSIVARITGRVRRVLEV